MANALVKEIAKATKDAKTEVVRSGDLIAYTAEEGVRFLGQGKLLNSDSFPGQERSKMCLCQKVSTFHTTASECNMSVSLRKLIMLPLAFVMNPKGSWPTGAPWCCPVHSPLQLPSQPSCVQDGTSIDGRQLCGGEATQPGCSLSPAHDPGVP